jgi:glutamate-ammonia-ligase adenylyltransferase
MGKFGGREPNYHSDVDVVFAFEEDGSTHHPPTIRGRESTTNQHFFSELGQRIVKTISEHSTNGRLYDSDPRLRPVGSSGPYAISLDEFRRHFLSGRHSFGKLRALCQARPIYASEPVRARAADVLREILTSSSLIGMDGETIRRERLRIQETAGPRNLKRGPGGTVDIEFIVQALQLRNAKVAPTILRPNTLAALESLVQSDFLNEQDAKSLCESYEFLRRVEARLRLLNTTARHDLPREADELAKLAYLLRFDGSAKLESECARFTRRNRRLFEKLVA